MSTLLTLAMTQNGSKKGNSYHHGNLRSTLIEEAIRIISKGGIDQLTLRELARHTKVSHTAPYRHFQDKTALLVAVAEEGFQVLQSEMRKSATRRSGISRLKAMGVAYVSFAQSHAASFRVMFGPSLHIKSHPSLKEAARTTLEILEVAISECQSDGEMKGKSPHELALLCWSVVHGLAHLTINGILKDSAWDSPGTMEVMISLEVESLR